MAGHPTIGSTFALAARGRDRAPGGRDFVFELGVGPTPVSLEWDGERAVVRVDDAAAAGVRRERRRSRALAAALGMRSVGSRRAICRCRSCRAACRSCSCRLRRVPRWTRVAIDRRALTRALRRSRHRRAAGVLLHDRGAGERSSARPSTAACSRRASASPKIRRPAAPAVRSAVTWCSTASSRPTRPRDIVSLQGVAMGRPSRIHISIDARDGGITRVRVGGARCWSDRASWICSSLGSVLRFYRFYGL